MRSPTFETEWFDDQPYPGPAETYPTVADLVRVIQEHMQIIWDNDDQVYTALVSSGLSAVAYSHAAAPTGTHFTMPTIPQPKVPRHVGPRSARMFDRKGKRKF